MSDTCMSDRERVEQAMADHPAWSYPPGSFGYMHAQLMKECDQLLAGLALLPWYMRVWHYGTRRRVMRIRAEAVATRVWFEAERDKVIEALVAELRVEQ